MSIHRAAAARRARIRELLRARTQDQPLLEATVILELLGDPALSLRTIERDLVAIRETCRLATVPTSCGLDVISRDDTMRP